MDLPSPVRVLAADVWREGTHGAWQKHDGHWRGYVTYSVGIRMQHVEWVDEDALRRVALRG